MKKKFYLVTGGHGFIGSAFVRRLLEKGNKVRVLDDHSRGNATRLRDLKGRYEIHEGDIRDAKAVFRASKGVDSICHLAAVNGTAFFYSKPDVVLEVSVRGMLSVLDAAQRHKTKELVIASSSEVYQNAPQVPTNENVPLCIPDPRNPRYSYAGGKITSELLALHSATRFVKRVLIFRPHNVFGPDMGCEHVIPHFITRMMELAANSKRGRISFPIQGSGRQTRAFIFISDFIDGLELVLNKGRSGEIYHIGTRDERTISGVAAEIASVMGFSIRIVPGREVPGSPLRRCPDVTKLEKLGFKPRTLFREGLARTAEWYLKSLCREHNTGIK